MAAIEILALIFAGLILLKMLILIISPKVLLKLSDATCRNPLVGIIICLVLAVIVGYYIFTYFSIIEVASVMLLTSILIRLNFLSCPNAMLKLKDEIPEDRLSILRKFWLGILIWTVLAVLVLCAVF